MTILCVSQLSMINNVWWRWSRPSHSICELEPSESHSLYSKVLTNITFEVWSALHAYEFWKIESFPWLSPVCRNGCSIALTWLTSVFCVWHKQWAAHIKTPGRLSCCVIIIEAALIANLCHSRQILKRFVRTLGDRHGEVTSHDKWVSLLNMRVRNERVPSK